MLGLVAMQGLPIAQYPEIVPPMVQVTTTFIGASATDVEASVATPLEQQINGVEKGIYLKSTNANDGTLTLKVSFEVGSNQDMDNVLTQNRVSQAMPQMPQSVKNYGVTVKKALAFPLLVISIKSPNGTYDSNFLSNYTTININDAIARIPGVGQINLFGGSDYAMRVWLRPDVIGRLGRDRSRHRERDLPAEPADPGRPDRRSAGGRRHRVHLYGPHAGPSAERGGIRQHHHPDQPERLGGPAEGRRPARARHDALQRRRAATTASRPRSSPSSRFPAPTRSTSPTRSRPTMANLSKRFPRDMEYLVSLDTTLPVSEGITEIVHTLFEAVGLVIIVVFIFLQNWRATLIPLMTVPVSLVGAFIFFPLLGFSINVLSLLGLVLAIGIVVDDAIVVVEAVMHHIEHGMAPKEATIKAMEEVSGPVIAIGLILSAVFVPVGFMGGITGRLYQQFAITIALSVLLSVINALTLSPALAALLLKPATGKRTLLTPFYNGFNKVFGYHHRRVRQLLRHPDQEDVPEPGVHRRADLRDRRAGPAHSRRLRAGRGPGLHHGQRAAARRGVARAHRRRHEEGRSDSGEERGHRGLQHHQRLLAAHLRLLLEHGLLLRAAQAVGGAQDRRGARERCRGRLEQGVRAADSGGRRHRLWTTVDSGPRHRRRLHDAAAGSQRRLAGLPGRADRGASWRPRASGRRSDASARCIGRRSRRSTPTSIAARC